MKFKLSSSFIKLFFDLSKLLSVMQFVLIVSELFVKFNLLLYFSLLLLGLKNTDFFLYGLIWFTNWVDIIVLYGKLSFNFCEWIII